MKTTISKILGVGLSAMMLASTLLVGAPAKAPVTAAGTLSFLTETLPTTATVNFVDFAVAGDGTTIYGVVGTNVLYKSTNGGTSWVTRTIDTAPGFEYVAVSPDDANIVAVADAAAGVPVVWISTNGAATGGADSWSNAAGIATVSTIRDIAISHAVSGVRQVAIVGVSAGALSAAESLNLGGTVSAWTRIDNQGTSNIAVAGQAWAVKFSPNYVSDRLLVAVSQATASGNVTLNLFRFLTNTTGSWNETASFTEYTGNISGGLVATVAGVLTSADLSLSPTYSGTDSESRVSFVALNSVAAGTGSIYQMKDAVSKAIGTAARMQSVAFNGTTLLAGRADNNVTYYSANPTATTPTVTATTQFQRPSGGVGATATGTLVGWAGSDGVASTQGAGSAFARSADSGVTYQDVSMFKSSGNLTVIDAAVVADGSEWYMVTHDATNLDVSVWNKTGTTWTRLMSIIGAAPTTFVIRVAPEDNNAIYLVQIGTTAIYASTDGGDKNWVIRVANDTIIDLAVESASVVYYAYAGGNVRKSTNSGFLWSNPATNISLFGTPFTIKSLGTDKVMLTSTAGRVAYSTNGGTSFTSVALTGGGSMQTIANTLASGDYIYAAPGAGNTVNQLYRYKIGSVAPDNIFKAIGPLTVGATETFTGITLKNGILYAVSHDTAGVGSRFYRSINPAEAGETSVTFSQVNTGTTLALSPDFTIAGGRTSNLQISTSGGVNTIWGIDADAAISEETGDSTSALNSEVYAFNDTLATGPAIVSPADAAVIGVNPVGGGVYSFPVTWNRPSLATSYNIHIATDAAFNTIVATDGVGGISGATPFVPGDAAISPVAVVVTAANAGLMPGTTYYVRVRAAAPVNSPWSAARKFSIGTFDKPFAPVGPEVGATDVSVKPIISWNPFSGALWYQLIISEDPTFAIPDFSHNVNGTFFGVSEALKNGTTYYWRVRGVTGEPFTQGSTVVTPAGPWVSGAFTTVADPETTKAEPTVVVVEKPAPPAPPAQIVTIEKEVPAAIPSWMLMTIILIGAVLIIALIVLIVRTRRVA